MTTTLPASASLDRSLPTFERRRVVLLGGFGMRPKATMRFRALPLGQELAMAGHDVTLVLPPWDCPDDAGREWAEGGVRVVNVPLPTYGGTIGGAPVIVRALVRAVRDAQPDLVHLFQPKGYGGLAARVLRDLPLVVDVDDWEGAGGWNDVNRYPVLQRRLFAWQERDLPRRAAMSTVASRVLATRVASFGVPPVRVVYLPNALARNRRAVWECLPPVIAPEHPTLLVYSRFVECAPAEVAAVFARVRQALPKARLLIIGGSEAARPVFAPFGDAVTWRGDIPFDDLPEALRAADVALVPFADTPVNRAKCSVKTLDLLAVGLPIVATAVGENTEMIRDDETGMLVPPDDLAAAAAALVALLTDQSRRRALGKAARDRAWREQTWAAQLPALLATYARALMVRASGRIR